MPRRNRPARRQSRTPHTPRPHGVCAAGRKQKFTKLDATIIARKMRRRDHTNHSPYPCPSCHAWHVGSYLTHRKTCR